MTKNARQEATNSSASVVARIFVYWRLSHQDCSFFRVLERGCFAQCPGCRLDGDVPLPVLARPVPVGCPV
jgi:hypothetical protein